VELRGKVCIAGDGFFISFLLLRGSFPGKGEGGNDGWVGFAVWCQLINFVSRPPNRRYGELE